MNITNRTSKIYRIILMLLVSITLMTSVFGVFIIKSKANVFDPRNLMCMFKMGRDIRKLTETDYFAYSTRSKSVIGVADKDSMFRGMLEWAEIIPKEHEITGNINLFERFGVDGIKFSSYAGEAKYFDINPCKLSNNGKDTNFGQFYETRKEPLSTYGEANGSNDIRTKIYNEGLFSAWAKALSDGVANTILMIAKFFITVFVILVGFALTDISSAFGLTLDKQESLMSNLIVNLFFPLVGGMFIMTAVYIVYKGIIQRQYRESLINGLVKTLLSFTITVILFLNPSLVKLPNKTASFFQSLIVLSMSNSTVDGQNDLCITQTGFNVTPDNPNFIEEANQSTRAVVTCRIWENFLMKPFIEGQFGSPYSALMSLPNENSKWVKSPTVRINLVSSNTNWGLFYVSVMSGKHTSIDKIRSPLISGNNKDYYRIIDALSNYEEEVFKVSGSNQTETLIDVDLEFEKPEDRNMLYKDTYIKIKNNQPLKEWNYFIGNNGWYRIWYAILIVFISVIGSILPLLLAIKATITGLVITLFSISAPVFLLFGCWGGQGNQILQKYIGNLSSLIIKKALYVFLMLLSIIILSSAIDIMSSIGYFKAILLMAILGYIIFRNQDKILGMFLPPLNALDNSKFKEKYNKIKSNSKATLKNASMVTVAGVESKKSGGTFSGGAVTATKHLINNKMYRSKFGRQVKKDYYETSYRLSQDRKKDSSECSVCGVKLTEDSVKYKDSNGNVWCNSCASTINHHKLKEQK